MLNCRKDTGGMCKIYILQYVCIIQNFDRKTSYTLSSNNSFYFSIWMTKFYQNAYISKKGIKLPLRMFKFSLFPLFTQFISFFWP